MRALVERSIEIFFFFVGGLEEQAGKVIIERVGQCISGSVAHLVECGKVLKLFFVLLWRL
ncbi:hypothetical protein J5N97_028664 [Dioscorea zingiberensis]|uniref:Uncharacterized protein n=1 Tax=Dioscorea zingiberensis TaxID=325984 RepID=A0A9D5H535_9LILI|nr:hypothetical protein J5N97_028664 [Dioscorea zingiberensis]